MKKYINCVYVTLCTYLLLSYPAIATHPLMRQISTEPTPAINNFMGLDSICVDEPFNYTKITDTTPSNKNPDPMIVITTTTDNNEVEATNPDLNPFYIKHYFSCQSCLESSTEPSNIITTLDIQAIKRNAYVQLTPFKTDTTSSTYEYLIVTYVEKSLSVSSSPSPIHDSVSSFKPITQKHFYITPMTRKINYNVLPISAHFLPSFLSPSNNEKTLPPYTYHFISDDDDEDPPFPLPIPGIGDLSDEDIGPIATHLFLNTNERGYPSLQSIHLFTLINQIGTTLKMNTSEGEDPPFPLPIPGVGKSEKSKEKKYVFIATHADDEDPPFPLPIPGVGDTVKKIGIKETIIDTQQYILIPIENMMEDNQDNLTECNGDVIDIL